MRTILAGMMLTGAIFGGHHVDAETYYVAPLGAVKAVGPDGSLSKPFESVWAALFSGKVKGGDTVLLMDGTHGSVVLYQVAFDAPVSIASQNDRLAHIDWISIRGASSNLTFEKLTIWPTDLASVPTGNLIVTQSGAKDIVFQDIILLGNRNASDYLKWDAQTWDSSAASGIYLDGPRNIARRNQLTGVNFGITLNGTDSMAIDNVVEGFNGDGLRALGPNNVLRGNTVKNCVATNGNHDDGIQGFNVITGKIPNLVIDRNTILEWTAAPDHPLRCQLQGMFLADAAYENLIVTNNLVSTTHYHGLSLDGGINAKIVNNTVVNAKGVTGPYPWLKIGNARTPVNVLVANNLGMSIFGPDPAEGGTVTFRNNSVIGTPGAVFVNPFAFDYRPKATSGFVDTADAALAPPVDLTGKPRPLGNGPDRGAYEIGEAPDPVNPPIPEDPEEVVIDVPDETEPVVPTPVVTDPVAPKPVVTKPVKPKSSVTTKPDRPGRKWVSNFLRNIVKKVSGRWSTIRL